MRCESVRRIIGRGTTHPFVDFASCAVVSRGTGLVDDVEELGVEVKGYLVCLLDVIGHI